MISLGNLNFSYELIIYWEVHKHCFLATIRTLHIVIVAVIVYMPNLKPTQYKCLLVFSIFVCVWILLLCFSYLLQHPLWLWVCLTRFALRKQCWNTQPYTSHHKMQTFSMWRCSGYGSLIHWVIQCFCTGSLFLQQRKMLYGVMAGKEAIFCLGTLFIQ